MSEGSIIHVDHDGDTYKVLISFEGGYMYSAILSGIPLDEDTAEQIAVKALDIFTKEAAASAQG